MLLLRQAQQQKTKAAVILVFICLVLLHVPLFFLPAKTQKKTGNGGMITNYAVMSIQGSIERVPAKKKTQQQVQAKVSPVRKSPVAEESPAVPVPEYTSSDSTEGAEEETSAGGTGEENSPAVGTEDVRRKIIGQIQKHKKYPLAARKRSLEGDVELSFLVHPDGTVHDIQVVKSNAGVLLREAAVNSVRLSFPVEIELENPLYMDVTLRFTLER